MILILGGTTEGRMAVKVADEAGSLYYYATRGSLQQIVCKHGIHVTGGMNLPCMIDFCRSHSIRLLVDAAHPFAMELHRTVAAASEALQLPVVRVERTYPEYTTDLIWCDDYEDAMKKLKESGITRLLALTGVQTIGKLQDYWKENTCWFRILRREESLVIARSQGFDEQNIVYYEEEGEEELISRLQPQAILTKESGDSGGFSQKVEAARKYNLPVYVVKRPELPGHFVCVTGEHGLRKQIETHASGFFSLRSGFTTGACATAASKAALLALLGHGTSKSVSIRFPNGEELSLPIATIEMDGDSATATVVKDAGDDPDVTHGQSIVSTVCFCSHPGIHFLQGEGVGVVTLPGLGLEVGEPAINRVPRQMMIQELSSLYKGGLEVTISVPGGRELAQRTFNPKLGIIDGISIIGTSGIVRPFSSEAFVEAIRREVEVCKAVGCDHLVINSGAKSERFLKAEFPELPMQAFVHFGNFIGETLRIADEVGMKEVTLGIMVGKAVKLAEGHLDTHSKKVVMNKRFLKQVAMEAACSNKVQSVIDGLTLARELWNQLSSDDAFLFFSKLMEKCYLHCRPLLPKGKLTIRLMDEEGRILIRTDMRRIYTRTGDKGMTGIHGGTRVPKDDIRIEANGCLDELNTIIGIIRSMLPTAHEWQTLLYDIQKNLMVVMSHVATPSAIREQNPNELPTDMVDECERTMDIFTSQMEDNHHFILPGGTPLAAQLHFARVVSRRAERRLWTLNRQDELPPLILQYINRLSDLFFVMARYDVWKQQWPEERWQAFTYKRKL